VYDIFPMTNQLMASFRSINLPVEWTMCKQSATGRPSRKQCSFEVACCLPECVTNSPTITYQTADTDAQLNWTHLLMVYVLYFLHNHRN